MNFFFDNTISAVQRQVYTGNKSVLTTVSGLTADCYVEPVGMEMAAQSGLEWGKSFNVYVEAGIAIYEGDVITISSENYIVKGLQNFNRLSPNYRILLVVKEEV